METMQKVFRTDSVHCLLLSTGLIFNTKAQGIPTFVSIKRREV